MVEGHVSVLFTERVKGLVIKSLLSKQHNQSWRNPKATRKIFLKKEKNSPKERLEEL